MIFEKRALLLRMLYQSYKLRKQINKPQMTILENQDTLIIWRELFLSLVLFCVENSVI